MKSLSFLFFTLILSTIGFSQGNLQFNQVVTLTGTTIIDPFTLATVPAGKVWKIEHSSAYRAGSPAYVSYVCNNVSSPISLPQTNWASYKLQVDGPIWLKAGDSIKFSYSSANNATDYFFSILEFNIVP
jgi:hypothetical protein